MDRIEVEVRRERDSMGEIAVPASALWGAQTQRALQNFPASGLKMPAPLLHALGLIKYAAAHTNAALGDLPGDIATAIQDAALEVAQGRHDAQFPLDLFQTGSGTSTNMNLNEVIAARAAQLRGAPVSPNDHVNMSQSSNDSIPTAIHLAAALLLRDALQPALTELSQALALRAAEFAALPKTGRTHLMDAMPITLGQEIGAWQAQIDAARERLRDVEPRLHALAQGGTAVGTGINAHPEFSARFCAELSKATGLSFPAAGAGVRTLMSLKIAKEITGRKRDRVFSYQRYLAVLSEGTEPLRQ